MSNETRRWVEAGDRMEKARFIRCVFREKERGSWWVMQRMLPAWAEDGNSLNCLCLIYGVGALAQTKKVAGALSQPHTCIRLTTRIFRKWNKMKRSRSITLNFDLFVSSPLELKGWIQWQLPPPRSISSRKMRNMVGCALVVVPKRYSRLLKWTQPPTTRGERHAVLT